MNEFLEGAMSNVILYYKGHLMIKEMLKITRGMFFKNMDICDMGMVKAIKVKLLIEAGLGFSFLKVEFFDNKLLLQQGIKD